jgi:molybdopterin molybdotransferase
LTALLDVETALAQILAQIPQLPSESVPLEAAFQRVLAEDVSASLNLPPFANSSMDGYAVKAADIAQASADSPVRLSVIGDIPAGVAPDLHLSSGQAARIMTGAPLPNGADSVVPVEQTDSQWRTDANSPLAANVQIFQPVKPGDYVRPIGEDVHQGETVLHSGTRLRPQDAGLLAALGNSHVNVIRQPRVAILSTGDELLTAGETLRPGAIYDANSYSLAGLVQQYGGIPLRFPTAKDQPEAVRALFEMAQAAQPDLILCTAGVSVGVYDVVRTVLEEIGRVSFWRVNVRPGKPLAFGQVGEIPFFGLPGNPVSAIVTFDIFVRPALLQLQGQHDDVHTRQVHTGEDLRSDGRRSYLRVKLTPEGDRLIATTTGTQSSGALTSMVQADALLIVPENLSFVPAGSVLQARLLRE